MKTRVICVSRSMGAGGEDVAREVSRRLGFTYVDEEIVATAAEREQVDVQLVKDAEKRQSFLNRLLESLAVAPVPEMMAASPGLMHASLMGSGMEPSAAGTALRSTDYFRGLIREVVKETARAGNVVIVAHAAAMALTDDDGVLRVLVTASPETRTTRLASARNVSTADAAILVKDSDRARRDYFKNFYDIREELPVHYDLVLNTDRLSIDQVVDAVVGAASR